MVTDSNRLTVKQREREAEGGERPWSKTLREHGPMLVMCLLWGPFSLFMALAWIHGERNAKYEHNRVDWSRLSTLCIINGFIWSLFVFVTSVSVTALLTYPF